MSDIRFEQANWLLATLLGWTSLCSVGGGALLGTPPHGAPASRGQAQVPDWCGDWQACGTLMTQFRCAPDLGLLDRGLVYVKRDQALGHVVVADWPSTDHAVRMAIVTSVIVRLQQRTRTSLPGGA